jgi:hypothetical protein
MSLLQSLMRTMRHIESNKKLTTKFWPRMHLLLLVTLIAMALLKEDPLFWRNAGGWPVPLRDFVKLAFYPFFCVELLALFIFSASVILNARLARRYHRLHLLCLPALWILLAAVVLIVTDNNIDNVSEGRALHWHP